MDYLSPFVYIIVVSVVWLMFYSFSVLDTKRNPNQASLLYKWTKKQEVNEEFQQPPLRAYPASWWEDPKTFELERRAIFSKEWFFVTHASRFKKAGDYRTYEIAGLSFIVILGKDEKLRVFHNVCRHRAYAVTKKEVGSSIVLGCRYHGWSYDTKGKLVKAPEFDTVEGFEKEANSLWEVRTKTQAGMVFVSFDTGDEVALLDLGNTGKLLRQWDMMMVMPVSGWKVEGRFNWKLLDALLDTSESSWMWPRKQIKILRTAFAYKHKSGVIVFVKAVPQSSTATLLECSVFTSGPKMSKAVVEAIRSELARKIDGLAARQSRIVHAQESLSSTLLAVQEDIARGLKIHAKAEIEAGREIHPAARSQGLTVEGRLDDDFCRNLEEDRSSVCNVNARGLLDW